MGNYIFETGMLCQTLKNNAAADGTKHDFGTDILPKLVRSEPIFAYDFQLNRVPGEAESNIGYWRDVGTIEAYFDANLDLRAPVPRLNLYNTDWPVRTAAYNEGPIKCASGRNGRRGELIDSIASSGTIIAGGTVANSVLGRRVFVDDGAEVTESILMARSHIGAGARLRRVIVDRNAIVPPGTEIGFDSEQDRERYHVSDRGIVVVEGPPSIIPIAAVHV